MEDIAVIGLGLRFPGNATSPSELWKVLDRAESQWSEFPRDRLNIDGYYHPDEKRQGSILFKGAHFLKDDVAAFDAPFFAVTTEEAAAIDPQQRILLEVCYEALENAGVRKEDVDGSDTAVYVGSFVKDYEQICLRDPDWSPQYAATGNGIAIMANRISYFFNMHGPSMTIDTGCSGSLISVHLAAQSLRTGETSMAIAAGAGMILTPSTMMPMTALNFLSPDGKCFTFDARANGYGRGEGIGAVIMKRLSDAIRDNDTIHAVIRGTSTNQDGRTTGITLPSREAQVANIRSVYQSAGLEFAQTAYVECHGTGTQAGDCRELQAISETLASGRSTDNPIIVGSIKTNVGHLEGAAGIAGLIKGILILEHGKIPPNINFNIGNPNINFEEWKVKIPRTMLDWPLAGIRRVSVNCFGFGGSNAHVIMDEAPAYLLSRGLEGNHDSLEAALTNLSSCTLSEKEKSNVLKTKALLTEPRLFCYSAHDKAGVCRVMDLHLKMLGKERDTYSDKFLRDYSYTLNCRRSSLEWKSYVVAQSGAELESKLRDAAQNNPFRSTRDRQPRLCFIFCGQGSQWAQMGKDLMRFKVFRESLHEASSYIQLSLGCSFNLVGEIFKNTADTRISSPEISQPATTALQVALVDLMRDFNVLPSHVVGHSSGEIAAAYASGALSQQSAWKIAYYRGLAAASVSTRAPKVKGAMIVVAMSLDEVNGYLCSITKSVQVACINSPHSITLSGKKEAVAFIADDLRQKKILCKVLDVSVAYHSPQMKLVEYDYLDALSNVAAHDSHENVKMFSSLTGREINGSILDGNYWVRNMISPVKYVDAIEALMNQPAEEFPDMMVELGPGASLRSPTMEILSAIASVSKIPYHHALSRNSNGVASLLNLVGDLWSNGCNINMKNVVSQGDNKGPLKCLSNLPLYPWNHSKSYWFESHLSVASRFREYPRQDLIGARTADSTPFEPRWRGFLRISENPWIQDHQIQKTIIYPVSGMICMILEAAKQMSRDSDNLSGYEISEMCINKAMIIPNTAHGLEVALNIKFSHDSSSEAVTKYGAQEFAIYSKPLDRPWERHATGLLHFRYKTVGCKAKIQNYNARYKDLSNSCTETVVPRQLYEHLDAVGMNYGSLFQNITEVRRNHNSCVSRVRIPDTKSKMPAKFEYPHLMHPATLDAMFHTLFAIKPLPMVPNFIKSIFVSADLATYADRAEFSGYATTELVGIQDAEATVVMTQVHSESAYVAVEGLQLTGLSTQPLQKESFLPNHHNLCTKIVWKEDSMFAKPSLYEDKIALLAHKHPGLAVLQVGYDSDLTLATLNAVCSDPSEIPRLLRYTILDLSTDYDAHHFLSFSKHNPSLEPLIERISDNSEICTNYHLIIICGDSHVDEDNLRKYLKLDGLFLKQSMEFSGDPEVADGAHILNKSDPNLRVMDDQWGSGNYSPSDGISNNYRLFLQGSLPKAAIAMNAFTECKAPNQSRAALPTIIILTPPVFGPEVSSLIDNLKLLSSQSRLAFKLSLRSATEILSEVDEAADTIIVSLLDFHGIEPRGKSVFEWREEDFQLFHTLQKASKKLLWITRGAQMTPLNPQAAPIVGLARTLMSEDPLRTFATLDLSFESKLGDDSVVRNIFHVLQSAFVACSGPEPRDMEFAEKASKLYIPRLVAVQSLNSIIEGENTPVMFEEEAFTDYGLSYGLKLCVSKPGIENIDAMYFVEFELPELAPDEVEITFDKASLSFLDFEAAMGRSHSSRIGMDVSGFVRRVGSNVFDFQPGDDVVALVGNGALQNVLHVNARFVKRIHIDVVPSFLISAYYAVVYAGRAGPGRRVLVHAGASAFGIYAIEMAMIVGAEVFATILGPDASQQRLILERRGLLKDHIFNLNSVNLVTAVQTAMGDKGIDVIYNPTQESIEENFKCLRKCGTIVQFSSKSMLRPQSRLPASSMKFVGFDLRELLQEDSDFVGDLFELATKLIAGRSLGPMMSLRSETCFEVNEPQQALACIGESPYAGFTSVSTGWGVSNVSVLRNNTEKPLRETINESGTYVLAGGLGGLGRSISELLISNGARHLVFLSRSGASSEAATSFVQSLRDRGITVRVFRVDICNEADLAEVVGSLVRADMPPVRGVFQCAAVIKDAVFDNMMFEDWNIAIKPKTAGSWNLVQAMSTAGLEPFFIFLSSSAGVIGNRGQSNYAAGNCFQDALAHYCRLQGRHAVSIDLGPVLGAGMLAEDENMLDILRASGFYGIRYCDFLRVVEHSITGETASGVPIPAQIVLGVGTGGIIRQNQPVDPYWSRTALYSYLNIVDMPPPDLSLVETQSTQDTKSKLSYAADEATAATIVCTGLSNMLAKAMNLLPEEIDINRPPSTYGVDSLVAVGVRSWVLNNCGVQASVFEVLSDLTIAELSSLVAKRARNGDDGKQQ